MGQYLNLNFDKACRICLKESTGEMRSLFDESFSHKLGEISLIKFEENDGLPNHLCENCAEEVNRSHNFRLLILKNDENLRCVVKEREQEQKRIEKEQKQEKKLLEDKQELMQGATPPIDNSNVNLHSIEDNFKEINENKVQCKICRKILNKTSSLSEHMKIHIKTKHICHVCGKILALPSALEKHIRRHNNQRRYKCNHCDMRFYEKYEIANHSRKHTGEKPYCCDTCGKTYTQRAHLRNHMRQHTGEERKKTLPCPFCSKLFATPPELKTHINIHTGDKPYLCRVCGKTFAASSSLSIHRRTHNKTPAPRKRHQPEQTDVDIATKKFACDICGYRFSRPYLVKEHKRIHTGEKPYVCEICSKGFTQSTTLRTHMKMHSHSDGTEKSKSSDDEPEYQIEFLEFVENGSDNSVNYVVQVEDGDLEYVRGVLLVSE